MLETIEYRCPVCESITPAMPGIVTCLGCGRALPVAAKEPLKLRAGDIVRHIPSGEEWVVAYQDGEYMSWYGWPNGEALVADCEMVTPVSDAKHLDYLREAARHLEDKRGNMARRALKEMGEALP